MKIAGFDILPVRVAYRRVERSALIARGGVCDVIVKLTSDSGLVGWGEATRAADADGIVSALSAMRPLVLGRDPWDRERIRRDLALRALWEFQPMTGNFAFAGVDMALWDLCGKEAGQPLYRLLGGAQRESVDYYYYLHRGTPEEMERQGRDGAARGYSVYYLKVGIDARAETEMLEALRGAIGPDALIRVDANMAWTVPEAARMINDWDERVGLDFVEAPVPIDPVASMLDLKGRVRASLCVNEGLWREADAYRIIKVRCGDFLCFSPYWVGSIRRYMTLVHASHLEGWQVCKHTHGELGLTAAMGQHLALATPNAAAGNQQTAQIMEDDLLTERLPIADGPTWGTIDRPGLGVEVDEGRLLRLHEDYRRLGQFPPYGDLLTPGRDARQGA
jgi:glucarate dehydratase